MVYPIVQQFLKFDISDIDVENLEKSVKTHLDREHFYTAIEAVVSDKNRDGDTMADDWEKYVHLNGNN